MFDYAPVLLTYAAIDEVGSPVGALLVPVPASGWVIESGKLNKKHDLEKIDTSPVFPETYQLIAIRRHIGIVFAQCTIVNQFDLYGGRRRASNGGYLNVRHARRI